MRLTMRRIGLLALTAGLFNVSAANAQIPKPSTGNPRFDQAVRDAVPAMRKQMALGGVTMSGGRSSLAAYALLKAGVPANDGAIRSAISKIRSKCATGSYKPGSPEESVYEAGVDAMLLADADPVRNKDAVALIADFLIGKQGADGSWDYPARKVGDTSMNQYGILGLWAAMRCEVMVPPNVWDKCAKWHVRANGSGDGGFAYHPGRREGPGLGSSTHNMTLGGTGTMGIIRYMLYPDYAPGGSKKTKKEKKKVFGVLEEAETTDEAASDTKNPYAEYNAETSIGAMEGSIDRGIAWVRTRWRTSSPFDDHKHYFYYAMERSFALNGIERVGSIDWFEACGNELVRTQLETGGWDGTMTDNAFAILFFMRPTRKILGKEYGKGLMKGDKGFDLDDPFGGDEKKKRKPGPLDQLLAALDKVDLEGIDDVALDIVEKIEFSDPEELVGELDKLKILAKHPDAEKRRIALGALGRSGDIRVSPMLIDALYDQSVDVMVEARNALCYVSRRPRGFGLSNNPLEAAEGGTEEEQNAAVNKWRKDAMRVWRNWYLRVRPYDERDDLWGISASSATQKEK